MTFFNLYRSVALSFLISSFCFAQEHREVVDPLQKELKEKVHCQLVIHNYTDANKTACEAVRKFPESQEVRELYIQSLSKLGDEKRLLLSWQQFSRDFSEDKYKESVLESITWGIIQQANQSQNINSKLNGIIATSHLQDINSVQIIKKTLKESNAYLREVALDLTMKFGDEALREEVLRLIEKEKNPSVRKKAIEVAAALRLKSAKPILEKRLEDERVSREEKDDIILALLNYYDEVSPQELEKLSLSKNSGFRKIACRLFTYFDFSDQLDLLHTLMKDQNNEVKLSALSSLGTLRLNSEKIDLFRDSLKEAQDDTTSYVSLLASWVLLPYEKKLSEKKLKAFLNDKDPHVRLQAAGLIGYSLPHTLDIAKEFCQTHPDEYVRANLSFFMAMHRVDIQKSCDEIYKLFSSREKYHFKEVYPNQFFVLSPASLVFDHKTPQGFHNVSAMYHEVAQLELLNVLAILKDHRAKDAISYFLDRHHFNAFDVHQQALLNLDANEAFEIMRGFLNHSDKHKRLEAALLLSLSKKDPQGLEVLKEIYPLVDKDHKQLILGVLGQSGLKSNIPFLMDKVYEPSQQIRTQAASSIIQCLRH